MTSGPREVSRRTAAVRAFLIADIRGYTRFTAQRGDEAASGLARRFADVAGEAVEAWGGELVELRGDEALAVFDSARQALRCAVELQDAFADETAADSDVPLQVGIGLDAGEAVPVDDGYRGAALNLAARLCSAAAGGETLASATILNLAGPMPDLAIEALIPRSLKGFEHTVEAASVAPAAPMRSDAITKVARAGEGDEDRPSTALGTELPAELDPIVPLIGRASEARWLRWHWRRARHGHGRTVVISGPPGAGKTRLSAELGSTAHAEGASVHYLPRGEGAGTTLIEATLAAPALLVVDDLDAASPKDQQVLLALSRRVGTSATLLLVTHREEAAGALVATIGRLAPLDRRRTLGPLDLEGIRAIAALYGGAAADQAPVRELMDSSGGIPGAVHRAAASWARSMATHRLGTSAERTEAGRRTLRAAQDDLMGDVATLEGIGERTRRFAPDGATSRGGGATVCPYKGLATFEAVDAEYYFGRDRLIAELIAKLVGNPFLGFVGASGSGKSSAVRAGLLPALAGGVLPGSGGWLQVLMRPGEHPLVELARALARALPDPPVDALDQADPLADALARLGPDRGLVLAVDQFEEVFTTTRDDVERSAFIELLTKERSGLRVVVTLRADHYGHCAAHPALARLISATHVLVGPLTPAELEAVIAAPAESVGLRVEPELIRALVADAGSEPAVLPLLSSTLLELWQDREDGWLTLDAYRARAGIHGAVARLAESAFAELDPGQAVIARGMFLRLAGSGEGEGVVRRRVSLSEVGADTDPAVARVTDILTRARLLTAGDGYIEVAHEALLREWPRFQAWLREDTEGRKIRLHLIAAARDWASRGRESADLYRGARLSAALDWATDHGIDLNASEREFLEASRLAARREVEMERRTNRRLRALLVGAGFLLVVAVAAGTVALTQAGAAREQATFAKDQQHKAESARADAQAAAQVARSRELAAAAVSVLGADPALSKALAVAAADLDPSGLDIASVLHKTSSQDATIARWTPPGDPHGPLVGDLHPDGRRVVVWVGGPDRLILRDLEAGRDLWTSPVMPDGVFIRPPRFSADGNHIVVGAGWGPDDGVKGRGPPPDTLGILVYNTESGQLERRVDVGRCGADLALSAGGTALAWMVPPDVEVGADCYQDDVRTNLEAIDLATGKRTLLGPTAWDFIALSADGMVAAYTDDTPARTTIVKDLATGKDLLRRENGSGARALSPDGSLLLYDDRPVQVIDVATGRVLKTLDVGALGHIWTGFGPSGTTAYLAGEDASLTAWDASSGSLVFRLPAVGVGQAAIGRQGRVAVSDEAGHEVLLVDATHRSDGGSADTCAGFSYARQLDVTAGVAAYSTDCGDPEQVGRSTLHVVDLTDMSVRLRKRDGDGQDIGLAPDGRSVATITRHGSIVDPLAIYDTTDGRLLVRMAGLCRYDADKMDRDLPAEQVGPSCDTFPKTPFPWYPRNVSYSPDGRFLASVSGSLAVWDAATGRLLLATEDPRDATSVIFTRDSGQAIVSGNCEVVVYSTDTWRVARRAKVDANVEACDRMGLIGFTPAGRLIALSGVGGEGGGWLHRFDGATLAVISSNAAHDGSPRAYAMNSDGTRVVTGAGDGVVRVWDSETGNLVEQLDVAGPAQGVAFVGNDKVAVTPSSGGMLLFELDRVTLLKTIKASIIRGFSPEECERFGFGRDCPTLGTLRDSSAP